MGVPVRHQLLEVFTALISLLGGLLAKAQTSLLRTLREAQATTPEAAVEVPLGNPFRAWQLRRLLKFGVVQAAPGGLYLDESVWQLYRRHRRHRVFFLVTAVLLLAGWVWWSTP
jgi:hypothetical protein